MILLTGLIVAGCLNGRGTSPSDIPAPGRTSADFQLQSLEGNEVALSDFKGRPVMVNFWATWCGPCRAEMPYIQQLYEDPEWSGQGLVILAVNIGESAATVKRFMEENGLTFTVLLDSDTEVGKLYNAAFIPTTYFIDKDGIIQEIKTGSFAGKADIERVLRNSIVKDES